MARIPRCPRCNWEVMKVVIDDPRNPDLTAVESERDHKLYRVVTTLEPCGCWRADYLAQGNIG